MAPLQWVYRAQDRLLSGAPAELSH